MAETPATQIRLRQAALMALPLTLIAGGTMAQTAGGSALNQAAASQTAIIQRFTPPATAGTVDIRVQDERQRTDMAAAEKVFLTLESVTLRGAVTLPEASLAPIWQGRLGHQVSLADLFAMAEAIDAAYLAAGYYALTVVPTQDFASGNITLQVYEGYVGTVEILSDVPGIERKLAPYIRQITAMRPIRVSTAERILLNMSDLAGLTITGTLIRPDTPSGAGTLRLEVEQTRVSGMVGVDNFGNDAVGPVEVSGNLVLHDVMGLSETTSLVAVTIPDAPEEMVLLQGAQDYPLGYDGLMAGWALTWVRQRPGGPLADMDYDISTTLGTGYLRYPFVRSMSGNLFGELQLNFRNDEMKARGTTLATPKAQWAYGALDWDRDLETGSVSASGGLGLGLGVEGEAGGVKDNFAYAQLELGYDRPLGEDWLLSLSAMGQLSGQQLPGATRFELGGAAYGRAFDSNTISGDSGWAARIAMSRDVALNLSAIPGLTLTAFADYGMVRNHADDADYARAELSSAGISLKTMIAGTAALELIAAVPVEMSDEVEDPGTSVLFQVVFPF